MFEWTPEHRMVRDLARSFCEREVEPHVAALEAGEMLPYAIMRKMSETFGLGALVREGFAKAQAKRAEGKAQEGAEVGLGGRDPALSAIVGIELARVCPGVALALGASVGLAGQTLMAKGTPQQQERWGLGLVAMETIGAWGLTEPDTGSNAFAMRTTARPDGDGYVLNGSKTLVTNAPHADVLVVYAKIDRGDDARLVHGFVLDKGMPGLSVGSPFKKLGMHASPTGEIFLDNVRVGRDRLIGGHEKDPSKRQAVSILEGERAGSPILALGIIERCIEESVRYARERTQFGKPIGEHQLVQAILARMYMHRAVVRNFVFQMLWLQREGKRSMLDACAAKLYSGRAATEVALDAIQLRGGLGYLAEGNVERFMRDAKLLEIGGGTNEIQMLTIARQLLADEFQLA